MLARRLVANDVIQASRRYDARSIVPCIRNCSASLSRPCRCSRLSPERAERSDLRRVERLQAVEMLADRLRAGDRGDLAIEQPFPGRAERHAVDEIDQLRIAQQRGEIRARLRAGDGGSRTRVLQQHRVPQQRLQETRPLARLTGDERRDAGISQQRGDVVRFELAPARHLAALNERRRHAPRSHRHTSHATSASARGSQGAAGCRR